MAASQYTSSRRSGFDWYDARATGYDVTANGGVFGGAALAV